MVRGQAVRKKEDDMEKTATENLHIRHATTTDREWVSDLMDRTLAPYYDGDHRAHADRIFRAHLAGGHDTVGFFSHE